MTSSSSPLTTAFLVLFMLRSVCGFISTQQQQQRQQKKQLPGRLVRSWDAYFDIISHPPCNHHVEAQRCSAYPLLARTTTTTTDDIGGTSSSSSSSESRLLEELLRLLDGIPANAPTSSDVTDYILLVVRDLEDECPTNDADVVSKLGGTWELVWTTQDKSSDQYNSPLGPLRNWINPLENQAYSNNPNGAAEGRLNPILPREIQDRLENIGLIKVGDELSNIRSTQSIDLKRKRVRNVVTFGIPSLSSLLSPFSGGSSEASSRRASLTVDIGFQADPNNQRRVNVKFEACRLVIPKTPVDINFPLSIFGPTGWLQTNYIDDNVRITRGHKGSVFVLKRPSSSS